LSFCQNNDQCLLDENINKPNQCLTSACAGSADAAENNAAKRRFPISDKMFIGHCMTKRCDRRPLSGIPPEEKIGGYPVSIKQAILDRVRVMNKHVTNKLLIRIAGKKFGHFSILRHEGRKSGKFYAIPILAEPVENGFVIALTYGKKVDWCANVLAKGGCKLTWKEKEYALANPRFVDREVGLTAFPSILRMMLKGAGIQ
jgi:hypothetical protein